MNAVAHDTDFAIVSAPGPFLAGHEGGICIAPDYLLALLNEIGRHRALADHETDIVEAIVCRGHRSSGIRIRWTSPMDRRLINAAKRRGGVRLFAEQNGMNPMAAHKRLEKLRREGKATSRGAEG